MVTGIGSHLDIDFTDEPGRVYKSCRDAAQFSNENQIHTFALEMVNRDIFPMYRGQISLSLPMTESDVNSFVTGAKEIAEEILVSS